ncbi:MAG TPA: class F sortase [Nocardioides sp.]|nr:class F sortase [Nocardioides sp.]
MTSMPRPVLRALLGALVLLCLALPPARAEQLGPGHASSPGFSGYVTRAGHELGIARIPGGPFGICLDTGSRRWPSAAGSPVRVTEPVTAYLLSRHLDRARSDGELAAALWWAVGRLRGLNAEPERMSRRLAELGREAPALRDRVLRRARALLADAHRFAPLPTGYAARPPALSTDGPSGSVTDIGLRSARGHWTPGVTVRIDLSGAAFADGSTSRTVRTGTGPVAFSWLREGAREVVVRVRYTGVPEHHYLRYRLGARYQRVATSAGSRTLGTSARTARLSTPALSTQVNRQRSRVGDVLVDAVTVTGSRDGRLRGEWILLGPVAPDQGLRCRAARWSGAPVAGRGTFVTDGDSILGVGRVRVRRGGCYTYRERLLASATSTGAPWTPAGLVEETSLAAPHQPAVPEHPQVDTGARWTAGSRVPAPEHAARVVVPSARIAAGLSAVGFRGAVLPAPHRRSSAGVWDGSVPLSSLVGTTLLAGHVSDVRDRPGAFHGLRRVRVGHRITTTDTSGVVRHWRVVRIGSVDRRRLPRSLFQQGVARRLVLVTCTDRVIRPNGGFHYRRNLVVQAVPW